ncbi:hypothetical protein [Streptomyces flavofungini]|uniref:Uncharacterized protein n=1 Tax=Streptomyces flavofungini TaxID=68200 RepID=A0ABS0XGR0_9ACTN|nr:hypothetical protein [Streptomyces flavofungini]MBJ3812074.1 hypothetical protein [Streptomyces flavofungini]
MSGHTCPECQLNDRVAKVSAIVAAGTSTTTGSTTGWSPGISADGDFTFSLPFGSSDQVTATELSRKLRLAEERGDGADAFGAFLFFALSTGLVVLFAWGVGEPDFKASTAAVVLLSALGCLTLSVMLAVIHDKSSQRAKERNQRARAVWETLYYCQRDDVVYVPRQPSRCVPSDRMSDLWRDGN